MNNRASYIRLGTLALMWGSSFLLIKLALNGLSPTQIALIRIALGAVMLLALCAVRGLRPVGLRTADHRQLWLRVLVAGLFASALPWVLFGVGEQTVPSGVTGVLNATTPLWTVLVGLLSRHEKQLPAARLTGLCLGFAGVVLICAPWQGGELLGWGVLACLLAAASYGIGYVYIGHNLSAPRLGERVLPPLAVAAMQMTAATGIAVAALPVGGLHAVRPDPVGLLAVAALGIFGTGLAFALNYRLISDEGPMTASTVTYLMPIVSVVLGWLVLGEPLSPRVLLGMLVVLVGVALSRRDSRVTRAVSHTGTRDKASMESR